MTKEIHILPRAILGSSARALLLASGLITSTLFASPAAAQESTRPSPATASGEPLTVEPLTVVVTSSRGTEEDPHAVPQAIDVIDQSEFEQKPFTDIDDAMRRIPGVGMYPAEGNPNYWQEGVTLRGLGAQRVLTLTDGVRQAGQGIGYGGGNMSLYDPYGIERIEVLRGPASVLYGTDAFGGVVNIITREPTRRSEFGVGGGASYLFDGTRDMNRMGGYLDIGDEGYGLVFGTSYTNADRPNVPGDEPVDSGSFRNLGLWGKFDIYLTEDSRLRFLLNHNRNSDVLITDTILPLPIALFPPPGSSEMVISPLRFDFPEYTRTMSGVEYTAENLAGDWESFKTGAYWQRIYREFHRSSAFYPTGSPGFAGPPFFVDPEATITQSDVLTDDSTNTAEWQTQAVLVKGDHRITVGADFGADIADHSEIESQTVVAAAGVGPVAGASSSQFSRDRVDAQQYRLGLYAEDKWKLSPVTIIPGVRVDGFMVDDDISGFDEDEFGASGSVGSVYDFNEQQNAYLTLASGFRVPDLGERFTDTVVNFGEPNRVIGNADLDPERSWSAELGTKYRDGKLRLEAATYVNKIEDYITSEDIGVIEGIVTEQFTNASSVLLYGGEIGAILDVTEEFELYSNASRTWSPDRDVVDLANWSFNYGARHTLPINASVVRALRTGLDARTVLESNEQTTARSAARDKFTGSSFTVVDLLFNLDVSTKSLGDGSIILGVKNLFDKEYKEPFLNLNQPERSLYAGMEVTF